MTPGRYKGNDEIGRLIHDFKCLNSEEAYNSALAAGIKQYKETEGGREEMSDIVERYGDKREKRGEKRGETLLGKLILALQSNGRDEDIARAASDSRYRKKLYKELNISV